MPKVTVDNGADPAFTKVTVEVSDFPGLLRLIAWLLNGLDIKVCRAQLSTTQGYAKDFFMVKDALTDKQVKDPQALQERLEDFLATCVPAAVEHAQADSAHAVYTAGHVVVDNSNPVEKFTVVRVTNDAQKGSSLQLLEMASTLTGLGLAILEAEISVCDAAKDAWVFRVSNANGHKLDNAQASSLLYAIVMATSASNRNASQAFTALPD